MACRVEMENIHNKWVGENFAARWSSHIQEIYAERGPLA
jgi:hypothetical protein